MTTVHNLRGERRPFKEWTGEHDFSSVPPGREDPYMFAKDWWAPLRQTTKDRKSYGQLRDGFSRSMFRMSVERDADEGMRGYSGESGTGDGQHNLRQGNFGMSSSDGADINSAYGYGDETMDLIGHLPQIDNYEELLKTKEGRDEIRRIRQKQLREVQ